MIIEEVQSGGEDLENGSLQITITTETGSKSVKFGRGEPEDMSLARDLMCAFNIADMLKMAYEAGARGETLEIFYDEEED